MERKIEKNVPVRLSEVKRWRFHEKTFGSYEEMDLTDLNESFDKNGVVNEIVIAKLRYEEGTPQFLVDGFKKEKYYKLKGVEEINATVITVDDEEELKKLMVELQCTKHNSYSSLFAMINLLMPVYSVGQGCRSHLAGVENGEDKSLNLYEKIGKHLSISGNKVKQIWKVGNVNPLHFERIETSRMSLHTAYLECLGEEKGEGPVPPTVKQPVFHSNNTGAPEFNERDTTESTVTSQLEHKDSQAVDNSNDESINIAAAANQNDDEAEYIMVTGYCTSCDKQTVLKIKKSDLL